jgi:hypothetical protein
MMFTKIKLATLAALPTAISVHGAAFAQSNGDLNVASGYRFNKAINNLGPKIPPDAFGSIQQSGGHVVWPLLRQCRLQWPGRGSGP